MGNCSAADRLADVPCAVLSPEALWPQEGEALQGGGAGEAPRDLQAAETPQPHRGGREEPAPHREPLHVSQG